MSGTLVPMSTGEPAGTHQNLKILGTAGYPGPRKFEIWVSKKFFGYRWVLSTGEIFNDADPWL